MAYLPALLELFLRIFVLLPGVVSSASLFLYNVVKDPRDPRNWDATERVARAAQSARPGV